MQTKSTRKKKNSFNEFVFDEATKSFWFLPAFTEDARRLMFQKCKMHMQMIERRLIVYINA